MSFTPDHWIQTLNLQPHPEGGFFCETWRSPVVTPSSCLPDVFTGERNAGTAIYYLLTPGTFSHLHRLHADEVWHHYDGGVLKISVIYPDGGLQILLLGKAEGALPQLTVPAGVWFGAQPFTPDEFVLAGCTMAPGFHFDDFEMGERERLLLEYPQHGDLIHELTTQ